MQGLTVGASKWTCRRCTLANRESALECIVCLAPRRAPPPPEIEPPAGEHALRGRFNAVGGGEDGVLRLWNTHNSRCMATLPAHRGTIWALAVDWEEQEAVTGGSDRTIRLWSLEGSRELRTFVGHTASVLCVLGDWHMHRILSGSTDNTARVWDMSSGECTRTLPHSSSVTALAAAWALGLLLTGATDGTVRLWDVEEASGCLRVVEAHGEAVTCLAARWDIEGGAPEVLSGSADGTLRLWNLATGASELQLAGHEGGVCALTVSWAKRRAISGSSDGTAKLWRLDCEGGRLRTWQVRSSRVLSVAADWDAGRLLSGTEDGALQLWDIGRTWGQLRSLRRQHTGGIYCCALEGDDRVDKIQQGFAHGQKREEMFAAQGAVIGSAPKVLNVVALAAAATARAKARALPARYSPEAEEREEERRGREEREVREINGPFFKAFRHPVPKAAAAEAAAAPKHASGAPKAVTKATGGAVPKPAAKPQATAATVPKAAATATAPAPAKPGSPAASAAPAPKAAATAAAAAASAAPKPAAAAGNPGDDPEELEDFRVKGAKRGMPKELSQKGGVKELRDWLNKNAEEEFHRKKVLSAWRGPMADKFEVIRELGNGLEGVVYMVRERAGGRELVAKECHVVAKAKKEFEVLKSLQHNNILKAFEYIEGTQCKGGTWKPQALIIAEMATGGDLLNYIKTVLAAPGNVSITEAWLANVHAQVMGGLAFMHEKKAMHNDLKPENLLVMDAFRPKEPLRTPRVVLADFGLATIGDPKSFQEGDPRYISPEGLVSRDDQGAPAPGPKADVWAMGAILFELTSGGCIPFLYEARNVEEFFKLTPDQEDAFYEDISQAELDFKCCETLSQEARDLISSLMAKDPAQRPTAREALKKPWYKVQGKPLSDKCMQRFEEVAFKGAALKLLLRALSSKLQQDHLKKAWEVFKKVDVDFNLDLDEEEFVQAAVGVGRQAQWAKSAFSTSGLETLNFNEFAAMTFEWKKLDPEAMHANLSIVVQQIDKDGSGEVDLDEMDEYFGGALNTDELEDMLKRIDLGGDGKVSAAELQQFLFSPTQ